jgi:hypothetical protein
VTARKTLAGAVVAVMIAGCGSQDGASGPDDSGSTPAIPPGLRAAERVSAQDFPPTAGRTLRQIADTVPAGTQAGLATSVLLPGRARIAFGMIGPDNRFLYGKTALYVARRPSAPARGPYPAPADPMIVSGPFQSRQSGDDVKAVYETTVPFHGPGRYAVLAVTRTATGLSGGGTQVTVRRSSPIPAVGARPPRIHTPTVASVGGDIAKIDTRDPHDDMHDVDFHDALGRRPVALLFSTPLLCQSRVCGPVTDIAASLEPEFGDRVTFIHQEVFVDNEIAKGLRPQLRAFHLETEPWLFTFTRQGRVAARLEGAFGVRAFRRALRAALR